MTPKEFYKLSPIKVTKDNNDLYKIIEMVDSSLYDTYNMAQNERIEVRILADHCFDGRRGWYMSSVWFDDQPVMIVSMAGRELDDYQTYFVTDKTRFNEMFQYIRSLIPTEIDDSLVIVPENEDISDLTSFYGRSLDEFYSPRELVTNYSVGDIVNANIIENHLTYDSKKVVERCKITYVDNRHPTETYHALRIDTTFNDKWKLVKVKNKGTIYTRFSEADVVK